MGVPKSRIGCQRCRQELDSFVEGVLHSGEIPERGAIPSHLESCLSCSQAYIHLLDLVTAAEVRVMQDSLLDPSVTPDRLRPVLKLWQLELDLCNQMGDLRGIAVGLSVVGMVDRQLGDLEEAKRVHELALQMGQEASVLQSKMLSHADLGYIALVDDQTEEALAHLTAAHRAAIRLTDTECQARMLVLLGDVWRARQIPEKALRSYRQAQDLCANGSVAEGGRPLVELVKQRMDSVTATRGSHWQEVRQDWSKLQARIQVVISEMRASFENVPRGMRLEPVPVPVRYRGGEDAARRGQPRTAGDSRLTEADSGPGSESQGWSVSIPEAEGQAGYDVQLSVFSPTGRWAHIELSLFQRPGTDPLQGAQVEVSDDVGLPVDEPRITDDKGRVAFRLPSGTYDVVVSYRGSMREIPLEISTEHRAWYLAK